MHWCTSARLLWKITSIEAAGPENNSRLCIKGRTCILETTHLQFLPNTSSVFQLGWLPIQQPMECCSIFVLTNRRASHLCSTINCVAQSCSCFGSSPEQYQNGLSTRSTLFRIFVHDASKISLSMHDPRLSEHGSPRSLQPRNPFDLSGFSCCKAASHLELSVLWRFVTIETKGPCDVFCVECSRDEVKK